MTLGSGPVVVRVPVASRPYDVHIGAGVLARLPVLIDELLPSAVRLAVVTQPGLGITVETGRDQRVIHVPRGEPGKSLGTVEAICRELASWGLTRRDAVIAVGGGMVTDLAGLAASLYHRGIPVLHVPTTLLGQVDAAIGGKTGANLPEGKNLVGTFWQPVAVLCDTQLLATLPPEEYRSGLGEIAKYHFLGDVPLDDGDLVAQVAACVRIKAAIVAGDEKETVAQRGARALPGREVLNYGHTLAHALETAGGYGLRHGEAVAIGLVYAAELAMQLGRIGPDRVAEHRDVVTGLGLPTTVPAGISPDELIELFRRDKKALGGVTFVLDGPRGVEPVPGIAHAPLRAALDRVMP